jgi:hypothetical protein
MNCCGFVLVDTRTKETIFYKQEVQQNMRLKVQRREGPRKEYQASLPIPLISITFQRM